MSRYFFFLLLLCSTPLWASVPNPTNNIEYALGADSAKGRDQTLSFDISPFKKVNLDASIGSSNIPLEDGTEETSYNYSLGADIFPESPLTVGGSLNSWGQKDNLEVLTYDLHLERKNEIGSFFVGAGIGRINTSDMQFIKTRISLYDVQYWNLKFYFEKYNYQNNVAGLATEDASDLFSESALYLASQLLSDMAAAQGLYELNDEWDVGAYYELSQSATDNSQTQLASFLADYYPSDPWRFSLEVGHYRPFHKTVDAAPAANYASLASRFSF